MTDDVKSGAGGKSAARQWLSAVFDEPTRVRLQDILPHLEDLSPLAPCHRDSVWLKRDDLGPFGTHKARGIGVQLGMALTADSPPSRFCISSSGNAAVALGGWCQRLGLSGVAFLSEKTAKPKVRAVAGTGITTVISAKPKNFARYYARFASALDLRPSKSPDGALGYRCLAGELTLQLGQAPTDVFFFVNSGMTLRGCYEGFVRLKALGRVSNIPRLHAVQNTREDTLAGRCGVDAVIEEAPTAGALGSQTPPQLDGVVEAIQQTQGKVWPVSNDDIEKTTWPDSAPPCPAIESRAAYCGFHNAVQAGEIGSRPVVVVAGPGLGRPGLATIVREREADLGGPIELSNVFVAADYADIRDLVEREPTR